MRLLKNTILLLVFMSTILFAQDWAQFGSDIDGDTAGDLSGYSVSLSSDGTILAIGAILNQDPSATVNGGYVRILTESGGVWIPVDIVEGSTNGDNFGYSVSLSSDGSTLAVGAPQNDTNGSNSGTVYIYSFDGSSLTLIVLITGEAPDDRFGESVSISADGTRLAVGSQYNDGNGTNAGHVRVFSYNGSTLSQIGNDIDGEAANDQSGRSVSLSSDGKRVAIGAPFNDGWAGHVRVYSETGGVWTQVGSDIDGFGESGRSVSISSDGKRVVFQTPLSYITAAGHKGSVSIYSESGGAWTKVGNDIVGPLPGSGFGTSVDLAVIGSFVAIGSPRGNTSGLPGGSLIIPNHARVYTESGGVWSQIGSDITGESIGDKFGTSVSISSDGSRIAVGGPGNDGTDTDAGHARIYFLDAALPVELASFTVENTIEGVLCSWTTESEIENLGFLLERKTSDIGWQEIASYKTDDGLMGQGTISYPTEYEYLDTFVELNTTYDYRLADVDYNGVVTYHSVRTVTVEKAPLSYKIDEFIVMPAYPNPFNPSTTITYGINEDSKVNISIYDITGQLINTLQNGYRAQGWHAVEWKGTNQQNKQVPGGIYLSKITSNNITKTTKLMLLK
jgi:hypothetical protein